MADTCTHLGDVTLEVAPSGDGCVECGHVGCCDQSPKRHATAHFHEVGHPLIQSFEPGEEWFWCYVDDLMFEVPGRPPSPAHS